MSLITIEGTITAVGSSQFNVQGRFYAYIELTDQNGRRISLQKVFAMSQVDSYLGRGMTGAFYFDEMVIFPQGVKQLWGIKCDNGEVCFDRTNIRFSAGARNILTGLILALFFVGLLILALGLCQCFGSAGQMGRRERLFYGADREEMMRLRKQEAIRI
jgi:hypothetical protein